MIIQHLKDFFKNPNHLIITGSLMALSSLGTYGLMNSLNKKSCEINKPAYVYFSGNELEFKKKWIHSIMRNELYLQDHQESEIQTITFDKVKKLIIFFDEEMIKEEELKLEKPPFSFNGKYKIYSGGYEGYLSIYYTNSGTLGGYLQFPKWGKGKIELLKFVQIQNNQILFIRSCEGKECIEIGSPYSFKQTYTGSFNSKGELEGKYSGTHSSGQWKAIRIQN
ncbi:MAG: hypothetical protein ACK4UJ_05325 [Leptonema sp. (in: bacteria)]